MRITATTRTRDIFYEPDPPESDCQEEERDDSTEDEQDDREDDDETGHDYDLSDLDDRPDYDPGDWGQPGDGNYYP